MVQRTGEFGFSFLTYSSTYQNIIYSKMNVGSLPIVAAVLVVSLGGMVSGALTSRDLLRKLLKSMGRVEKQITYGKTRSDELGLFQSAFPLASLQGSKRVARRLRGIDKKGTLSAFDADKAFQTLSEDMGLNSRQVKGSMPLRIRPSITMRHKLYCKNGYLLAVYKDGRVNGTLNSIDDDDSLTNLEFLSIGRQLVLIRSASTNRYIAMKKNSRVVTVETPTFEAVFVYETYKKSSFFTFRNLYYRKHNWYLAIKRTGQVKPGRSTAARQSSAQFLLIRSGNFFP